MRTSRRIFLKSAVGLTGAATAFHASAASRFLPGQIGKWKLARTDAPEIEQRTTI